MSRKTKEEKAKLEEILNNIDPEGIKRIRTEHASLTQFYFAGNINVTTSTVNRWERDVHKPDKDSRKKIARKYGDVILADDYFNKYLSEN